MMSRPAFLGLAAAAVLWGGASARASETLAYSASAFAEAQKAGRPILVHITAPWCGPGWVGRPSGLRRTRSPNRRESR